ncbi:winged helix-turn-helix domain-containing tetratricopeptide repeat protein [Bradyrhizobium japonicum]|uniref:TolB-like protein/tetratricopeptide (TPR) repeat protein n=1 Tax=Bradyrhizobium japonicum TaxID=375 RepID=A0ABV2S267_BRAJP|nr:winged helix-turn-helix domain-containing tetratricopeptide repeat protein [Bradyrhizobium japonicum]MBR0727381.1 winged helix-turn-helix domain-containing protein [Bradyrhizobium japonicum]MBR0805194.1 winged helix-turn-helix domain-containing protein [Bradyrhizobium japonicum]MCP1767616.1 TolB-like protein/tetratricopeptide (TPR) repeat protein [Bradyrhizobium japonicum]MCP1789758.1 TolB-like protein/tetratricopeptide (TPR) repeat protein [Bradyrhizobium japonicum]MCP1802254.1 TolB-like p
MRYLFEDYELDSDRRELYRETNVVALAPQTFDFLDYLIRNRERVVCKDELITAIWKGRCVSDAALTTRLNAARSAIGDSGEKQRLIKTLPRKGYRFIGMVQEADDGAPTVAGTEIQRETVKPALALPDKPSLAVLPFTNLSSDPEQEYFADGMVEDIITGLSRSKSLFVIARQSTFTYKGKAIDIRQVGRELGVRYVLEGSVRRSGDRVRIAGQLIEATTGAHLWADRFDSQLKDIFDLQDQVTSSVIGALFPQLERAEIERAKRKPTENLQAYDYYLRALSSFYEFTREQNIEALRLIRLAVEIDPGLASAYALGAYCYLQRKIFGWTIDADQELNDTRRLAKRAIELDKDDPTVLVRAGQAIAAVLYEMDDGVALVSRAYELNPNLAVARYTIGWEHIRRGDIEAALKQFHAGGRLSPMDPFLFLMQTGIAFAHFLTDRYEDGASWAKSAVLHRPNYLNAQFILAACHAMSGRVEEARVIGARLMEARPALRVSTLAPKLARFYRPEHLERVMRTFPIMGLPP